MSLRQRDIRIVMLSGCSALWWAVGTSADDVETAGDRSAAVLEEMRDLMQQTEVTVLPEKGLEPVVAELVDQPLFHYVEEERQINDSTMWIWTHLGRPVAAQKLEVNGQTGGNWTYCFASLAPDRIRVHWPNHADFETTDVVRYERIDDAPAPQTNSKLLTQQFRALSRRFSAHADQGPQRKFQHVLRRLPRPIFEYEAPDSPVTLGAVFGFASGTNPDALLVLEARLADDGEPDWAYAIIRMTSSGGVVKLDDVPVYSSEGKWPQQRFPTWMYAFVRRASR